MLCLGKPWKHYSITFSISKEQLDDNVGITCNFFKDSRGRSRGRKEGSRKLRASCIGGKWARKVILSISSLQASNWICWSRGWHPQPPQKCAEGGGKQVFSPRHAPSMVATEKDWRASSGCYSPLSRPLTRPPVHVHRPELLHICLADMLLQRSSADTARGHGSTYTTYSATLSHFLYWWFQEPALMLCPIGLVIN